MQTLCLGTASTVLTLLWVAAVFNLFGLYSERIRYRPVDYKYQSVRDMHDVDIGLWQAYNRTAKTTQIVDCSALSMTACSTVCRASQAFSIIALIGGMGSTAALMCALRTKNVLQFANGILLFTALAMITTVALEMDLGRSHCAGDVADLDHGPTVATVSVLEGTYVTACVIWLWLLLCLSACVGSLSYSSGSVSEHTSS